LLTDRLVQLILSGRLHSMITRDRGREAASAAASAAACAPASTHLHRALSHLDQARDCCPVDCIHTVSFAELRTLEAHRQAMLDSGAMAAAQV